MHETLSQVVLLTEDGDPCGTMLKHQVHSTETPLHLGFSCHVLNSSGQVLLTRRSLHKLTWPGVWTNSFCGHPQPDETLQDAVQRHAFHELDMRLGQLTNELPTFRYQATDASGVAENEICPVFVATVEHLGTVNPDEVAEYVWATPAQVAAAVEAAPWAFSPWLVMQVQQMTLYGLSEVPDLSGPGSA